MKDRNHTGRGKGRSLFSEAAKGIGLISEHKDNHGRLVAANLRNYTESTSLSLLSVNLVYFSFGLFSFVSD